MSKHQKSIWYHLIGLDLRQKYYDVGGVRTRVLEAGEGHPIVFMHGGGGHAEAYARNIPHLAKKFKVYSIDMLGHGFTDYPHDRPATYDDMTKHLGQFQDAIGAEKIHLAGMSISGIIAGLYAGQNPKRVSKLLMNTGVPLKTDEAGTARYQKAIARTAENSEPSWTIEQVRQRLAGLYKGGMEDVPEELVDIRFNLYNRPGFDRIQKLVNRPLLNAWTLDDMTTVGSVALKNVECPTLVLWTKDNPSQGVPVAKQAVDLVKNGRLVVLENSGHWPQWEEHEKVNEIMMDFFSQP